MPVVSELVAAEVDPAPEAVQRVYKELIDLGAEVLTVTDAAGALADRYLEHDIVPERFEADALHIAVATVGQVDLLVSWNFRHIVHSTGSACSMR